MLFTDDAPRLRTRAFEPKEETFDGAADLICFSHLRWNFAFQRPQQLLTRCAKERRVFFMEEPVFLEDDTAPRLDSRIDESGVCVVVPHLPNWLSPGKIESTQKALLHDFIRTFSIRDCILWFYTPMALPLAASIDPLAIVYDCMDEFSACGNAPPELREREAQLLKVADVVFMGGPSLYEAKRGTHPNVYLLPSSVDAPHFRKARRPCAAPRDQFQIPRPRLGYAGVIDERIDLGLIGEIARTHPEWHIVMVGPIVKIDPADLPKNENIHYLGAKPYSDLPAYMAGWAVALLPFAINESTRHINPTKTPEYLAAGRRVVSTLVCDVARTYDQTGLVRIADGAAEFATAIGLALHENDDRAAWEGRVDGLLEQGSWNRTWELMMGHLNLAIAARSIAHPA